MKTLFALLLVALTVLFVVVDSPSPLDIPVFPGILVVTLALGLVSGLGVSFANDRTTGLSQLLRREVWIGHGLLLGLAMAALGLVLPFHIGLSGTDLERAFLLGAPAIAGGLAPVGLLLLHSILRICGVRLEPLAAPSFTTATTE